MPIGFADTAILAHYRTIDLAGAAPGIAVYTIFSQIVSAAFSGYQIVATRLFGGKEYSKVGRAWWHAALLGVPLAIGSTLFIWLVAFPTFLVGDPAVQRIARDYVRFRSLGLPFFALARLFRTTFDAERQTRWGMRAALIAKRIARHLSIRAGVRSGAVPHHGREGGCDRIRFR